MSAVTQPETPHLNPLPQGEEEGFQQRQSVIVVGAVLSSSLSRGERVRVRGCHVELGKLDTCEKPPVQPSAACGAAFATASYTATNSAGSIRSATESSTSSATTRSSRLSWMGRGTLTRSGRRQTSHGPANCWRMAFASFDSGTKKSFATSTGLSRLSFSSSILRSRVGRALSRPHPNPIPEGEEDHRRQMLVTALVRPLASSLSPGERARVRGSGDESTSEGAN